MKKHYEMIDGIPIWTHLIQNSSKKADIKLAPSDYGSFAEIVGKRYLNKATRIKLGGTLLLEIFSDIEILSIKKLDMKYGDITIQVNYKKDETYGKKVIIFEIKHGKVHIHQNQLRNCCKILLDDPNKFLKKADEIRIFYLIFDSLDTINATSSFYICELTKDFAKRILESGLRREKI